MSAQDQLLIHEIYRSIQGESTHAGLPCVFIRTSTCNLRCRWCDTPQAFTGGTRMARADVLAQALAYDTPLVEVTGGEPLLQPQTLPLMSELCDAGRTVLLETSGERDISAVDPRVHRIVDFKAPGSDESHRNRWENISALTSRDEVKFVVCDRRDFDWAASVVHEHQLIEKVGAVLFSCVWGELDPAQLVQWVLDEALAVRVQLQAHKYIWSPDATGV